MMQQKIIQQTRCKCTNKTKIQTPFQIKHRDSDVESEPTSTVIISSPMTGIAADLSTAPDEAFRQQNDG